MASYLVTGGAGFLGINLIRWLLARGHAVRSLDIADFSYPDVAGRVTVLRGDIRDSDAVDRAMDGVDIVVHAAAALPRYSPHEILSTDVEGTRCLLAAAVRYRVRRFIFISSTAVYGLGHHHADAEDGPLSGVGPYGKAKVRAEECCRMYRDQGLCVTILRPKTFVGPERLGVFGLLYEWASEGRNFPILGNGRNRYQLLDVDDLCEAIGLVAQGDPAVVNTTFNLGAKEFTTLREDFQAVLDAAGFGKRIQCIPASPAIACLELLRAARLSPLYPWIYQTMARDSVVSTERAERLLGFRPRSSNQEALQRNYRWYLAHARDQAGYGCSHRAPWRLGLLTAAKRLF